MTRPLADDGSFRLQVTPDRVFFLERLVEKGASIKDPFTFTIGQFTLAVLAIETAEDAHRFFAGYVEWGAEATQRSRYSFKSTAQSNIGWVFGEGMDKKKRALWSEVCAASHPIFGRKLPSTELSFQAGVRLGQLMKDGKNHAEATEEVRIWCAEQMAGE